MKKRFIIIVLDGFGIGAMHDAAQARAGDEKSNTLASILDEFPDLKLPTLEKLGLMNAFGRESNCMKFQPKANFGRRYIYGSPRNHGYQTKETTVCSFPRESR